MIRRWLLYLVAVTACLAAYWLCRQWLAWLLLVGVLCLPVVALILSLPAMLSLKLKVSCPSSISMGDQELPQLEAVCRLPVPPFKGKIRVRRPITGQQWKLKPGYYLPAEHCGTLLCKPVGAKVYDYLGLFYLRIRQTETLSVVVQPRPVAVGYLPELERYLASSWRPKPGGGFAENHELRLYRPGDSLNQVHWKLSAKTGKYIIREAMVPEKSRLLLSMILRGTPEELDRKFGRLLWLSKELLSKELRHEICALTGAGMLTLQITDEGSLHSAMERLLSQTPASAQDQWSALPAAWQYRIGGGEDEA